MKKYSSVFFDLDDTLLDTSGDEIRSIKKVFEKFNIPYSDDVEYLYRNKVEWQTFTLGKYDEKAVFTNKFGQVLDMMQIKKNRREMLDMYFEVFCNSHKIISGAKKMLQSLKDSGYRLYITSNGYTDVQRKKLVDSKLDKFFNGVFVSEDIDYRKPSKSFFDYVFGRVPESNRGKVLVVGDAQSTDVLGAKNAGFDCCWYNSSRVTPKYKSKYEITKISELTDILCEN